MEKTFQKAFKTRFLLTDAFRQLLELMQEVTPLTITQSSSYIYIGIFLSLVFNRKL